MPDDILKHFTSAAATYDDHAKIQRTIAYDLLRRCPVDARRILDAGCGTGGFTRLLASTYPEADITAIDFSAAMLQVAAARCQSESVRFVHADVRDVAEGEFDLVASNAALQWLPDINATIRALHARLAPNGVLAFTYFGPETYRELRAALVAALGHPVELPSDTFASPTQLVSIGNRHFHDCSFETVEYSETFSTIRALLTNIKATGTRGRGASPPITWTQGLLQRVDEEYRTTTRGEISVTYQVSFCIGRRV